MRLRGLLLFGASNLDKIKEACKTSDRVVTALIPGGLMALADEAKRLGGLKDVE